MQGKKEGALVSPFYHGAWNSAFGMARGVDETFGVPPARKRRTHNSVAQWLSPHEKGRRRGSGVSAIAAVVTDHRRR